MAGDSLHPMKVGDTGEIVYLPAMLAVLSHGRVFVEVNRDIYHRAPDPVLTIKRQAEVANVSRGWIGRRPPRRLPRPRESLAKRNSPRLQATLFNGALRLAKRPPLVEPLRTEPIPAADRESVRVPRSPQSPRAGRRRQGDRAARENQLGSG